jgi:hypothetical protein
MRGRNLSESDVGEVVCSFERIADLDQKNEQLSMNADQYRYQETLDEIEKLPLTPELRARIKAKYGLR